MKGCLVVRKLLAGLALLTMMLLASATMAAGAPPAKPTKAKICMGCHPGAEPGNLRAEFDSYSLLAQTLQLKIDANTEVVRFDKNTLKLLNASVPGDLEKSLKAIKKGHQVRAEYTEKNGEKTVTLLAIKPPLKVSADKLYKTEDVAKLLALGPEKGKYLLVDSRPRPLFLVGAIPTAVSIPYFEIKTSLEKFPKDKNALVVFYCAGPSCALSPQSAKYLESEGYTNVKVYHDGYPAWAQKNYGVVSPQALKEAWFDKELSFVLLDVRPGAAAKKGFIKGAVNVPEAAMDGALSSFPDKALKPPFVIYDNSGEGSAQKVAQKLVAAGYSGPRVLVGGIAAWGAAGYAVSSGATATEVVYVPKPKAGSCSIPEFEVLGKVIPANTVVIDVRNPDECDETGIIKGALNIPADQLSQRLGEIPKDKEIIVYCSTGARAEMAYNILKDKGYRVRFLEVGVDTYKDGTFEVQK
jgi:rhodanese-related sulfurtransferase